jgi:hypothetical protein
VSKYKRVESYLPAEPLLLLVLFVPTGTQDLNNFTTVEVSIAVKFFTETGLLALCSNPQPRGVPILVAIYDMHGLQWDYSFPRSPHAEPLSVSKEGSCTMETITEYCNVGGERVQTLGVDFVLSIQITINKL